MSPASPAPGLPLPPLASPRRSGRTIKSLKWFFIVSCGLLLLIAAGLVSQGVVFFTTAGLFGTTFPYEASRGRLGHRPPLLLTPRGCWGGGSPALCC